MASSAKSKITDEEILEKMAKDFHELVTNKEALRTAVENFLNNTFDELTLGIIFDLHRKYKTGHYDIEADDDDDDDETTNQDDNNGLVVGGDIFGQNDMKKIQDVTCPNCGRCVAAARFAPHLEACMGVGRSRSRSATRRVASNNNSSNNNSNNSSSSKDRENLTFTVPSDDEDDMDWNSGNKRGKKKKRNGNKKSKGTPKKNDIKSTETICIEMEQDDDELANLVHDYSNGSSPADSVSSTQSTSSKKKEKTKSKKNKRERSSPNTSISTD